MGRVTLAELVRMYTENTVADVVGVKAKVLQQWLSGKVLPPAPARSRLHVLRAAQKHLGRSARQWLLTRDGSGASPAALLRKGDVDAAWSAFRRALPRA